MVYLPDVNAHIDVDTDTKEDSLTFKVDRERTKDGQIKVETYVNTEHDSFVGEKENGYAKREVTLSTDLDSSWSLSSAKFERARLVILASNDTGETQEIEYSVSDVLPERQYHGGSAHKYIDFGTRTLEEGGRVYDLSDLADLHDLQQDKEASEDSGVLGGLRDGAELDGVFGASNLNADLSGGIGGLIGAEGVRIGSGSQRPRGSGLGGGGTAEGLGGLGTKGRGRGSSGYGSGGGNFGAKGEGGIGRIGGGSGPVIEAASYTTKPQGVTDTTGPIVLSSLDKSLIDATVKRHMNQVRYCYQEQLTKDPDLTLNVNVNFTIGSDGRVSEVSATSSQSTGNEESVQSVLASLEDRFSDFVFPEPKGGGIVVVNYPIIFAPA